MLVGDKLIFSKANVGRFPLDGEVEKTFAELRGGTEKK